MVTNCHVLDSYALLCFFKDELGAETVEKFLDNAKKEIGSLYLCTVNLTEIYYSIYRQYGKKEALLKHSLILNMPVHLTDVTLDLVWHVAEIKANYPIALGDCFAIGLAKQKNAKVITGDPEFKKVQNEIDIVWLPSNK